MNPTRSVLNALGRWHSEPRNGSSRAWVFAEEVRVGTGFTAHPGELAIDDPIRVGREQRIDAFAIHTWPSKRFARRAYEIKISRADLRRDLDKLWKQDAALALSNEFYLAVPPDLSLDGFEFPPEWGVLTIGPRHGLRTIKRAPWRDTPAPPYSFMVSLARNLQQAAVTVPINALASDRQGQLL